MKTKKFFSVLTSVLVLMSLSFMMFYTTGKNYNTEMIQSFAAEGRLYNQNDSKWKNVKFTKYSTSGNDMYTSGCGIFSFCNAIYALNGNTPDAVEVATWAVNNGSYQPGNGGMYRQQFYNNIQSAYGDKFNFKIDGQYSGKVTDARLINHLKSGGVAAIHVYNHFMAITGYNASNNTYHVIESAVYSGRGLQADSWVSASKMSSDNTNVDWYALISNKTITSNASYPEYVDINISAGTSSTPSKFSWKESNGANNYYLRIFDSTVTKEIISVWGTNGKLSWDLQLDAGEYTAQVGAVSKNNSDYVTWSQAKNFIVEYNPYPEYVDINISAGTSNTSSKFSWKESNGANNYYLRIFDSTVTKEIISVWGTNGKLSWDLQLDAGEYTAQVGAVSKNNSDYVTWSQVKNFIVEYNPSIYTVLLNANGGSVSPNMITVYANDTYLNLPVPNKTGYYFTGWFTEANGETQIKSDSKVNITSDTTLYAHWTDNTAPVISKTEASDITISGFKLKADASDTAGLKSVTANVWTWKGFDVDGKNISLVKSGDTWSCDVKVSDFNKTYGAYYYQIIATDINGNITKSDMKELKVGVFTVTFDPNGGTVDKNNQLIVYNYKYSEKGKLPVPVRKGYVFDGWYTDKTGGTKITDDTIVSATANQTLFTHWKEEVVKGDCNDDDTFNVADVVILQKWLLADSSVTLKNWKNADLYEDNKLDVFDLVMMKQLLIQ